MSRPLAAAIAEQAKNQTFDARTLPLTWQIVANAQLRMLVLVLVVVNVIVLGVTKTKRKSVLWALALLRVVLCSDW